MDALIFLAVIIFTLSFAFSCGTVIEAAHYRDIKKREMNLIKLAAVTFKSAEREEDIESARLVMGSVVISLDYFKRFLAGLRAIFGGRIAAYETLFDRGRREAVLRMKDAARALGADIIVNTRFQTSTIGSITGTKKESKIGCFEVLVYGTAINLKK